MRRGGSREKPRSPVPAFCSRRPPDPPATGERAPPSSPRSGREGYGGGRPARCPPCPLPAGGAARVRRGPAWAQGARGRRSGTARRPQPPLPRPPPAPAPQLTVLVVLEVVVGAGPAAALGRVLHVVELQKVRPLAREAQEGGGQAPRQGHQPPGAGERRERAEGAAGRAGSPRHGTGKDRRPRGSGPRRCPPRPRCPARRGYQCSGARLRGFAPAERRGPRAGSRPARRRWPRGRRDRALPPPRTSAAASRRQKRSAPRAARPRPAGPRRGPSRRGGERSGEGRKAGAGPAPRRPRLPASWPRSFPAGGSRRDPRSGRAEQTPSPSPTYPAGRGLSGRPSASGPRPLRTAGGAQRSCSPGSAPRAGLELRGAEGSEDLADTPLSARRDLGKARLGSAGGPVPAAGFRVFWVFLV